MFQLINSRFRFAPFVSSRFNMPRLSMRQIFSMGLILLTLFASATRAQQSAHLAPADAGLYIEVANLAELRTQMEDDPVVALLKEQMPHRRQPRAWEQLQQVMGLSGEEIFDRYFGRRVVVIAEHARENPPGVLLTRVADGDVQLAIEKLELEPVGDVNGFTAYRSPDGKSIMAFGRGWMAMAANRHRDYARGVLEGIEAGGSLAEDETFVKWTQRVPADRQAMVFAREGGRDVHVLSASQDGERLKVHYAGKARQWRPLLEKVPADATGPLTYGPLPASTIAAVSLNLKDGDGDPRVAAFMDRLLAGKSFRRDVMPKLATPAVVWLSRVRGDALTPAIEPPAPAVGVALHMRDATVAEDLQRVMEQLVVLFNVATMKWQTPPATARTVEHSGMQFRAADVGQALAERIRMPRYAGMVTLTWGRVGEWFVVTTSDAVHREAIDAAQLDTPPAALAARLAAGGAGAQQPVVGVFLAADMLGDMMIQWMAELEKVNPAMTRELPAESPGGRRWRKLGLAAEVLGHYRIMAAHLRQPEEGVVEGAIEVERR